MAKEKILAIYDIMGIQEFVFYSNKLKENIGGSCIVSQVLEKFLPDSIKEKARNPRIDWKSYGDFRIMDDGTIDVEIVYIGGGNAVVAYDNEDIFREVNKSLSRKVLEETGGLLRFATACIRTDFNSVFMEDRKRLFEELARKKNESLFSMPLLGISITREGQTDGLPAVKKFEGPPLEYISYSAFRKREVEKDSYRHYTEKFLDKLNSEFKSSYGFIREMDDLRQKEGESYIAVVHIDGNNMGKTIEDKVKNANGYKEAVKIMRDISKGITEKYNDAMESTLRSIIKSLEDKEIYDALVIKRKSEEEKDMIPIRPIVLNGDDITFVCTGKIGVSCAEVFLKRISNTPIKIDGGEIPLSACAGVALVKSHFPFYRAYSLAEELCGEAKKKAKVIAKNGGKKTGSWLDFHMVYSGVTTDLNEIRKKDYNIPGMPPLNPGEYGQGLRYSRYNLLWRPWCVSGDVGKKFKWEHFKEVFREFKKEKGEGKPKWPRSKLKALRSEFIKSIEDVETLVMEFESRGLELPDFAGQEMENKVFVKNTNQTPYFDALELIDMFIDISG